MTEQAMSITLIICVLVILLFGFDSGRLLLPFDHIARFIVNANHGAM